MFEEVHMFRRLDLSYWGAKAVGPSLLAMLTVLVVLSAVTLGSAAIGGMPHYEVLTRLCFLAPLALICGILVGIGAGGIGLDLPDPFLATTIVAALLPLSAGVIVPVSEYPAWLSPLTFILPGSGITRALSGDYSRIMVDIVISAIWMAVGLAVTYHAVSRIRAGIRRESL